jgi:class 3 adenylate cyclase
VHYAKSGEWNIAWGAAGRGELDIVLAAGWLTHLDLLWEHPGIARLVEGLARFARVIMFDKRGVGLSDRVPPGQMPSLEGRIDDLRAVLDAAGSDRAYLFAIHEAGPVSMVFAASDPARVAGLIPYGTWACGTRTDDYPWAPSAADHARMLAAIETRWGTGLGTAAYAPSLHDAPWFRDWQGRVERAGATPAAAKQLAEAMAGTDVRDVLATIAVPTLVLHRVTDRMVPIDNGRYLAGHIPNAELVELPSGDHFVAVDPDQVVAAVQSWVTGRSDIVSDERVLATVLFTDIVDSTARAAQLGDRRWRQLLDWHDQLTVVIVERHRGRVVKTTGDGIVATFDGPGRAVHGAAALVAALRDGGVEIRAGLHTGEIEPRGVDVGGIAVHIAARVASLAGAGDVLVSRTVVDLVAGSDLTFEIVGDFTLKGIPGTWTLHRLRSA